MNKSYVEFTGSSLSESELHKTLTIVGSGRTARLVNDYFSKDREAIVWALNNAWTAVNDYDKIFYSDDFPAQRKPPAHVLSRMGLSGPIYYPKIQYFNGILLCGATIALAAGYTAISMMPFSQISFFACDMNYGEGQTHFYGVGSPDPLRRDPSLQNIRAKFLRLFYFGLKQRCLIINASPELETLLSLPRDLSGGVLNQNIIPRISGAMLKLERSLDKLALTAIKAENAAPFATSHDDYRDSINSQEVWSYCAMIDRAWLLLEEDVARFSNVIASALD